MREMNLRALLLLMLLMPILANGQSDYVLRGIVRSQTGVLPGADIKLAPIGKTVKSNVDGSFQIDSLNVGNFTISIKMKGYEMYKKELQIDEPIVSLDVVLQRKVAELKEVVIKDKNNSASGKLRDVVGTAIYAGKKTEIIHLDQINANLATNNTRQIYARIPGLNIWEYDRGGLQLGIGGRGLSPNRSSNFNIRQNGYDISADALGYPESYYTPSAEAIDRIEIVRGAAGLQYGPQFGGMVNFVMKEGPSDKKYEVVSRQTGGSFGFLNSFNSIGGTVGSGKLNYYAFYQYKTGDSWRPNSHYDQHNAYLHLAYKVNERLKLTGQYTFMNYVAQQPGGLTDAQFAADPTVSVRARNWFKVNWNLISLTADYQLNDNTKINWRTYTLQGSRDALGILSYINRPDLGGLRDRQYDVYNNLGSELRLINKYKFGNELNTWLAGVRVYQGLTTRKQGDANEGIGPDFEFTTAEPNRSWYRFPGANIALFSEHIFRINKHWSVTPGARFEFINTRAKGYYYKQNVFVAPDKIEEDREDPRSFFLLGIGTAWKQNNGVEWYANVSQNYRSINFNDMRVLNVNARVDPNLKDETGYNADIGVRGNLKEWLYMDVSAFYLKYNDRIGSIFSRDSNFMTYRLRTNVADSRNLGLETLLEGDILQPIYQRALKHKLIVYTSFSLIDARYINTLNTAIKDKLVENVPPVLFRTGASFGSKRYNITYQFAYQSKQYSDATNTEVTPTAVDGAIPAFSVMDLSVSYNWKIMTLFAGINNLGNSKYFTRRADGYPGPGILPADIRNYYLTLQVKL